MRLAPWALLFAVYLALPHWSLHGVVAPRVTSGDEPHYLLMVNSLLEDRDLVLGPDYARVARGGPEAGAAFRGIDLDHHTILVDPQTGRHALWQHLFDLDQHRPEGGYQRIAPGFESGGLEVAAHPPAFSALVALLLAPLRLPPERVEPFAIEAVALISFSALLAIYAAARRAGLGGRDAAVAVLLAGLCSSLLPYARSFFSEPAIALALALALWAWASGSMRLAGFACFAAAAIKPPFGTLALGWAALLLRDGRRRDARALLAPFLAGCTLIAAFNFVYARTLLVAGARGFEPAAGLGVVGELFFSDNHGVFTFVPWTIAGVWMIARASTPLLRAMAWGATPVLFVFLLQEAEGGGFCYGPRYLVPFLPWLAIAAAAAPRRRLVAALGALGLVIAVPGALRYRELFAKPVTAAFLPRTDHR
ncbi:MAG TPA: hypothetical protein VLW85_19470 [Myxococcales bacterium]|nr:hypothetical protein [Myxococcales bacterium]